MLLPPARTLAVVIVFVLFLLLGRIVGVWLNKDPRAGESPPAPPPTATPTVELAETWAAA